MTDADAVLRRIDNALGNCVCGEPLTLDGGSLDYCSEDCQEEWQGRIAGHQQGFQLAYDSAGRVALRRAHATVTQAVIPVTYDFIDQDALADLCAGLDQDDPRIDVRDNLNRIQGEVWNNVLLNIHHSTVTSANGSPDEGQEVFIGFDVTSDSITYALVTGDTIWRTGSFPIPEGADRDSLTDMGQIVVKGRWTNQPTTEGNHQ